MVMSIVWSLNMPLKMSSPSEAARRPSPSFSNFSRSVSVVDDAMSIRLAAPSSSRGSTE